MQGNIDAPDTSYANASSSSASPDTPFATTPDGPAAPDAQSTNARGAATAPDTPSTTRRELSADLYALASHVMRNAHKGAFETIAELDLSFSQIKTLYTIYSCEDELSLKALAESLGMTFATMSRTVDSLVERGFIDRFEDPEDRRMKRITLTDAGAQVPAELNRSRLLGIQDLVETITDQEAESLGGALRKLVAAHPEIAAHRPAAPLTPTTPDRPAGAATATSTPATTDAPTTAKAPATTNAPTTADTAMPATPPTPTKETR